ncbi:MAG: tetratricopeptide repeat protein [bacterium]|nr:tetratricopeptide repeat protein [bacterium]
MIDSAVKEINGFMSIKHWEDALDSIKRQPAKYASKEDLQIEAYLLHNLKYFVRCRDLCLSHSEEKSNDFDLKFILKSCENIQKAKASLLSHMSSCKRADSLDMKQSIGFLMGVFCDIRDVTYYLTSVLSVNRDPAYTYLLACIYRISGKLSDAISLLDKIKDSYADAGVLFEKLSKEYEAYKKLGRFGTGGKLQMPDLPDMNGEDMMVRGFWSIAEKDYQSAFNYLAEAIKRDPSLSVCWYYVGKLQTTFGAKERGDKCFKKFLEFFPHSSGYYKALAFSAGISDEQRDEYYQKWIGCLPSDPRSWMAYLSWLYSKKDFFSVQLIASEALDSYSSGWFIPKENPVNMVYRGMLNIAVGRTMEASRCFADAARFEPYKTVAALGMGAAKDAEGVVYDALSNYEKAMADSKAESISKYMLANVYLKRKNFKKAFSTIDEVISKHPESAAVAAKKAEVYLKRSDMKGFKKYVSELSPKQMSPEMHVLNAMVLIKEQETSAAESELRKALESNPSSRIVLNSLATLLLGEGKTDEAIEIADQLSALSLDPANFLLKGYALLKNGDFEQAAGMFEDYLSFMPFDYRGWLLSGIASLRCGKEDAARLAFEKSLLYSDGKPVYRLNLGLCYAACGMYEDALRYVEISPRSDSYYRFITAWISGSAGKRQEALDICEELLSDPEVAQDAFNLKAHMLFEFGRKEEAASVLEKACGKFPDNRNLAYNRAFVNMHRKQNDEAGKILEELTSKYPDFYDAWLARILLLGIQKDTKALQESMAEVKKLKNPGFKSWFKNIASIQEYEELIATISYNSDADLNFYIPEIFSLSFSDPYGFFGFDRLDGVFGR